MPKITNKIYREFLDAGVIDIIEEPTMIEFLNNITGKYKRQARALVILLYYTGGRPIEILNLRAKDIFKEENKVIVHVKAAKRGLPRKLPLPPTKLLVKQVYSYASTLPMEMLLFHRFRSSNQLVSYKKNGERVVNPNLSNNLRYYFNKWSDGVFDTPITPYILRHNRFSKFSSKGATIAEIKFWKGSRTEASVYPYLHMSKRTARKMSRML